MRLFLVRHGQTAWNLEGRAQGHYDTDLDETGLTQASRVASAFEGMEIDRLLTSDLSRSLETARRISETVGLEPEVTTMLRERSFGEFEGRSYDVVRSTLNQEAAQIGASFVDCALPGGESLRQVWNRVEPLLSEVESSQSRTVIVSHGGTIGLMIARMIGAAPECSRAFRLTNASVTELSRRQDGSWMIDRLNDTRHFEVAHERTGA